MSKSLQAILATARERISAAKPTTLGSKPGVDYAPKSSGDRAFVAKHTHIEQDYPPGMEHAFTGEPVKYSLNDPKMAHYGNKEDEAIAANEETQIDETSKASIKRFKRGMATALSDKKKDVKEEILDEGAEEKKRLAAKAKAEAEKKNSPEELKRRRAAFDEGVEPIEEKLTDEVKGHIRTALSSPFRKDNTTKPVRALIKLAKSNPKKNIIQKKEVEHIEEMWKASAGENGKHIIKHSKTNKVSRHTFDDKDSAIRHAVKMNKAAGYFKEDLSVEQLDELSIDKMKAYHKASKSQSDAIKNDRKGSKGTIKDYLKRRNGQTSAERLAGKKVLTKEEFISDEPEMDVVEGILCDKKSLGKKMKYHKGKMSNEDIGTVKFKHHQKQIHIIKGMLEEVELDERKKDEKDDGYEYKLNKRGFLEKKRKYEKRPVKEDTDPTVARIAKHIDKERF